MSVFHAVAPFRVAAFATCCALASSACEAPPPDPEPLALAALALQRPDAGRGYQASDDEADHATFVTGTTASTLELGGLRLVRDVCEAGDQACVLNAGRRQLFIASLDVRGRARWLLSPLQRAEESWLFATHEREQGLFVLASYRGAPALHPRLEVPAAQQQGLLLLQLDRRGSLVQARKLADSPGYHEATLTAEVAGAVRVDVTFQGRLDLSDRSIAAGAGGSRATLYYDPASASLTFGQVEQVPHGFACSQDNIALLCNVGTKPKPGCNGGVCDKDPFCCNSFWDKLCVTQATERIADCACTHAFGTVGLRLPRGCDNRLSGAQDCPSVICNDYGDAYCCDNYWDSICVGYVDGLAACDG